MLSPLRVAQILLFLTLGLGQGLAIAQSKSQLSVFAEESSRDTETGLIELSGNVQITFDDKHLSCDRAVVSLRQRTIDAHGSVLYTSPLATVAGERMLIDYEANTGVIYEGYVKRGGMIFEGNYIIKSSDTDYISENGQFTTCNNCPESWSFHGSRVRAELGGYAYLKNATLRVGGLPVFWLPYLIVPLKSDRQTGLLTPEFEKSDSGGLTVSQSLFWVISDSEDATITLKQYELRSLMGIANFRYLLNEKSHGEFTGALISDRVFASDTRLDRFRNAENKGERISRWNLDYNHYHLLPDGFVHRLQVANASDLQYPSDFLTRHHGESAMENRMSLTKASSSDLFFIDASYFVNLMQANPLASNNDAVHKIPEISYSRRLSSLDWGGLFYDWNVNYTNFARTDFAWDDMNAPYNEGGANDRHIIGTGPSPECSGPEWWNSQNCALSRDGTFDPDRDLIRTGQRLDITGSLLRSFQMTDSVDFVPKIQYRETQYHFNLDDQSVNVRRYLRTEASLRTTFSGIFNSSSPVVDGTSFQYKHEVLPELTLTQIPWLHHPSHPFFGTQTTTPYLAQRNLSDADINSPYGLQFDFNDRLYDRKLLSLGITNKLIQKRSIKDAASEYRQIVYWRIAQSYDYYQAESDLPKKQPLSDLSSELKLNADPIQIYQLARYFPSLNVFDTNSRIRFTNKSSDFVELQQVVVHDKSLEKVTNRSSEEYSMILRKSTKYLDFLGRATVNAMPADAPGTFPLKSVGYGVQFKLPGDCWNFTFIQIRPTSGDNNYRFSFDFAWAGKPTPVLPETLLDGFNL